MRRTDDIARPLAASSPEVESDSYADDEVRGNPNVSYVPWNASGDARGLASFRAPPRGGVGTATTVRAAPFGTVDRNGAAEWLRSAMLREMALAATPMHEFAAALSSALGGIDGSGPRTEELLLFDMDAEIRDLDPVVGPVSFRRFVQELEKSLDRAHGGLTRDPHLLSLVRGLLRTKREEVAAEAAALAEAADYYGPGESERTRGSGSAGTGTGLDGAGLSDVGTLLDRWTAELRDAATSWETTASERRAPKTPGPGTRTDNRLGHLMLRSEVRGAVARATAQLNRAVGSDWDPVELIHSPQVMPHFASYVALVENQRGPRSNGRVHRDGGDPVVVYRGPTRYQMAQAAADFAAAAALFRDVRRGGPRNELVLARRPRDGGGYARGRAYGTGERRSAVLRIT